MKDAWRLYQEVVSLLPASARRFLVFYAIALGLLSTLDAAALGLLAVVIGPIVAGTAISLPLIGTVGDTGLLVLLAAVCGLIVLKGALAVTLIWRATRRFARYELELGARLFDSFVAASWIDRLRRNSSDLVRLSDSSVASTISGFVLPATSLLGEILSFVTVVAVLAIAQPAVAAMSLLYLGAVGAFLFFWVTKRARQAGQVSLRYSVRTSRLITEMTGALKEVTLRDKAAEVAAIVRANRVHTTRARSNTQFLAQFPRYVLESSIIGGFVLAGGVGFLTDGVPGATAAIALFGLAGFRIAPSLVRFQGIASQTSATRPHAQAVVDQIRAAERSQSATSDRDDDLPPDPRELVFDSVRFRYSPEADPAVIDVSIRIPFGASVAFVGASGAGKSTMIDLILGLIEPTDGQVRVDGQQLRDVRSAWRARVGYVPQDVSLFDATIAQNVALTWAEDADPDRVRTALARAQMLETVEGRDGGIDARVGERGLALSGGQRQRLGIARALYAHPSVLVMDEATSALDSTTEAAVTDAVRALRGSITLVTVAHRLATVRHADIIYFMSGGRVAASGTFDELVASIPEFAQQAHLAGLADAPRIADDDAPI